MSRVYRTLGLRDFAEAKSRLEAYVASTRDYRPNRFDVNECLDALIAKHCREYADKYGYPAKRVTQTEEQAFTHMVRSTSRQA